MQCGLWRVTLAVGTRESRKAYVKKFLRYLMALALLAVSSVPAMAYTFVSSDSNGEVTFAPTGLVTPILTGAIAAVGAGAALVVLSIGVRWVYRAFKHK